MSIRTLDASGGRLVVSVIRSLGFVGNAHYCPVCLNRFHEDRGQHKPGCAVIEEMKGDPGWWDGVTDE